MCVGIYPFDMSSQKAYVYFELDQKAYVYFELDQIKNIYIFWTYKPNGSISKGFKGSIPVPGRLLII